MRKFLLSVVSLGLLSFSVASCSADKAEEKDPFQGYWVIGDNDYSLRITPDHVKYVDNDMDGMTVMVPYVAETPDCLSFTVDDRYPATVEYNEADKTATLVIKGYNDDGSDYQIVFKPENRFDKVTPYVGAEYLALKSCDDGAVIDTLRRGETVKWLKDTLNRRIVRLDDGRKAYGEANHLILARGIPSDDVFERSYTHTKYGDYSESISFSRHGDKVGVMYDVRYLTGQGAANSVCYVGDLDGTELKVNARMDDYEKFDEGDFASATPIEEPFVIHIIDNSEVNGFEPFVVKDGVVFKEEVF